MLGAVKYTAMHEVIYLHMTLSDINVVKYLLKNRYNIDAYYKSVQDNYYNHAGIVGNVNQELISLLASLDNIVSEIKITKKQKEILNLLEQGYTYSDIGKMTNRGRSTVSEIFNNLCDNIVKNNKERWLQTSVKGRMENE